MCQSGTLRSVSLERSNTDCWNTRTHTHCFCKTPTDSVAHCSPVHLQSKFCEHSHWLRCRFVFVRLFCVGVSFLLFGEIRFSLPSPVLSSSVNMFLPPLIFGSLVGNAIFKGNCLSVLDLCRWSLFFEFVSFALKIIFLLLSRLRIVLSLLYPIYLSQLLPVLVWHFFLF